MQTLYFDTFSLFYSEQYIGSDKNVSQAYEKWRCSSPANLLEVVTPDLVGIKKLRKAAVESGFKLYPLGTRYTRQLFIEGELFVEDELAPDIALSIRMDDSDPIRRMLAHAQATNSTWYVCGDCYSEILDAYSGRCLTSTFGKGVTTELISKITALGHNSCS
ncbi:hypothetical protein [Vibrio vulnificus]|nr:hypothetical protein [Vibrio parahaemolyticus]HAS6151474.1 hypothetical protein [Vibrio vulnificus]